MFSRLLVDKLSLYIPQLWLSSKDSKYFLNLRNLFSLSTSAWSLLQCFYRLKNGWSWNSRWQQPISHLRKDDEISLSRPQSNPTGHGDEERNLFLSKRMPGGWMGRAQARVQGFLSCPPPSSSRLGTARHLLHYARALFLASFFQ